MRHSALKEPIPPEGSGGVAPVPGSPPYPGVTEPPPHQPLICIEEVSFAYGDDLILDHISLSVDEGEFVSLIGPSGCGKSTLLSLLDGAITQDSGRVTIGGHRPSDKIPRRAMVFQDFGLLPWKTVDANIMLGLKYIRQVDSRAERRRLAREYLERVGLRPKVGEMYPYQLSGGMQQRVGLARALAVEPKILLMDEPFAALDAQTAEVLREDLRGIVGLDSCTVVFVTHNLDEAISLSERVIVMRAHPGRVAESVTVRLPEPGSADYGAAYQAYRERLWSHLRREVVKLEDEGVQIVGER